jgi:hypothetical protein
MPFYPAALGATAEAGHAEGTYNDGMRAITIQVGGA